ncbi:MAG: 3,4-dihydroxy-2-butanone-4-phosphate synthase [Planctomycetota bacterium]|nr:3,4-dihydroxy-2-butanone-4-phosphate synthase [Planctomycetota bacterium]
MPDVLDDLRAGKMVVLTDDESRENEGDLVLPAQFVTPESVTFMLREAKGYMCLSLTEADCDRLELGPQALSNTSARGTAFTVSIDGHPRHGFTTGVSAKERARCIQMAIDPRFASDDFVRPGHINPLRSRDGGVLVRTGQTEGSIDLCRLAGLYPAAIIIEIMRDDGEMARVPDLIPFCKRHGMKMCSVAQIIEHRLARESLVKRLPPHEGRPMRTPLGEFRVFAYESAVDPLPHLVLTTGNVGVGEPSDTPTLVRMHRRHLLGDVFGELGSAERVGSGPPGAATGDLLRASLRAIHDAGRGAVVYLRTQSGPGPHADLEDLLQQPRRPGGQAIDTSDVDDAAPAHGGAKALPSSMRQIGVGGQILRDLGLTRLKLLTNSSKSILGLEAFGLSVVEHVPISPTGAQP